MGVSRTTVLTFVRRIYAKLAGQLPGRSHP